VLPPPEHPLVVALPLASLQRPAPVAPLLVPANWTVAVLPCTPETALPLTFKTLPAPAVSNVLPVRVCVAVR
jgi:hypothetical protein